ncbi:MAG: germination protein YpeB [Clostridiales bacterium]|nr:germination protein YpeB [Clostridiales bacterium]
MKKQPRNYLLIALAAALCMTVGAAAVFLSQSRRYQARLRQVYEGALLSALRQTEDMRLMLDKALLTQDAGECARYLSAVSGGAAQVQRALSLLPLRHDETRRAMKFANQASDYAETLIALRQLGEEDAAQLESIVSACAASAQALYAARNTMATGEAAAFYDDADESARYDSAVEYPTLIYDGPFSDARVEGEPKALGSRMLTREEATQLARDFVGADRVIDVAQGADCGGSIPCYGVTLRLSDVTLEAAVSKQGGKVLWLFPDSGDFQSLHTVEECRRNAEQFLESRGYPDMRATYFQAYQGVAVIAFAATQGATLLYPDQIKVQLRMDTAQVVGIEARNYLQNHTARGALLPTITEQEAQKAVSSRLQIESSQLCLIPLRSEERLCFEFKGFYNGHTYLAYVDAATGEQVELLKLVETPSGLETV